MAVSFVFVNDIPLTDLPFGCALISRLCQLTVDIPVINAATKGSI
jgi:hypothetical protein